MAFDFEKIRSILACPNCRGELVLHDDALVCCNPDSRLSFPILDDIPRLLVDEATALPVAEWSVVMQSQNRNSITGQAQA